MGALQSFLDSPADVDGDDIDPAEPVRRVRAILSQLRLPAELVLEIMDLAEYYPCVRAARTSLVRMRADAHTRRDYCSSLLYLMSPPLRGGGEGESWRMKKVTWTVEGHDQGWGGNHRGTFRGSYSWYEACIFRPLSPREYDGPGDPDLEFLETYNLYRKTSDVQDRLREIGWMLVPNGDDFVWHVQSNRVANAEFERHVVEWRSGEVTKPDNVDESDSGVGFLDALRPGDRVGLWMRAMYAGWENYLKEASIKLVYDVRYIGD